MATHKSAEKRHRQSLRNREKNRDAKSAIRTTLKRALTLAKSGDKKGAEVAARKATSMLDKAVVQGVLHRNNARRNISRLYQAIAK